MSPCQCRFLTAGAVFAVASRLALAQSVTIPPDVERSAKLHITAAALQAPVRFLGSDLLEGRGPATRGDRLTRLYLATELQGMGLRQRARQRWATSRSERLFK